MRLSIRPEPEKPLLRVAGWYRASKQNYGWLGTSCKPADSTGVISSKAYTAAGQRRIAEGQESGAADGQRRSIRPGSATESLNFVTPYLRTIFGFIGITDVNFIAAGGTQKLMTPEVDLQTFLAPSLEKVHAQASL